jgi:hypothetical protein
MYVALPTLLVAFLFFFLGFRGCSSLNTFSFRKQQHGMLKNLSSFLANIAVVTFKMIM